MTDAEQKLWWHLRELRLKSSHFRRQATIGPFFVDFACHAHGLVIELDGGQHNTDAALNADARRTAFLEKQGYRVLRFWNDDVMENIDGVMNAIVAALNAPHP